MRSALIGGAVILLLAVGAVVTALSYEPADPARCTGLLRQAEYTSDAGTEIEEAECEKTPAAHDPTARP